MLARAGLRFLSALPLTPLLDSGRLIDRRHKVHNHSTSTFLCFSFFFVVSTDMKIKFPRLENQMKAVLAERD